MEYIVGDDVREVSPQHPAGIIRPVDSGITYALAHWIELCKLAIAPTCIQVAAAYVLYSQNLLRQQKYLIIVVSWFAVVWLLTAILMLAFEHAITGRRRADLASVSVQALQNLPKVFLAYVLSFILITLGLTSVILPGLVFLAFLLWAPAFCVGEIYAKGRLAPEVEEEEELDPDEQLIRKARHYFTYMSLWELGLSRSARFAARHFQTSVALALLVLSANLIPDAVVTLVTSGTWSFVGEVLGIVVSSFATTIVIAAWAWAFVLLLPPSAKKEIGIEPERDLNLSAGVNSAPSVRFENRRFPMIALIVLSALAGWFMLEEAKEKTSMPTTAQVKLISTELKTGDFVVSLDVQDSRDEFRWLIPYNFRLRFLPLTADPNPSAPTKAPENSGAQSSTVDFWAQLAGKGDVTFLKPSRVDIFDADGRVLSPEGISPSYRPLKIVLFYQVPANLPSHGRFELLYRSLAADGDPIAIGEYRLPEQPNGRK